MIQPGTQRVMMETTQERTKCVFQTRTELNRIGNQWSNNSSRNMRAAKDMQNYRRGYPNLTDDECSEERMFNLKFYLNEYPSSPDDILIESFHKEWRTDYKRLERVHSYIQWLFPLREPGVNYMASELTKKEIQAFRESEEAKNRLVESYELMLRFYGIQLVNKDTGEVKRADNWKERFANLERNMHNNLRITRILKSLGELGFEHYQSPLVRFFLEETLVKNNLSSIKRSVFDYFLFAVRDKQKRKELLRYAFQHFEPKDRFVWCPRKIQKQLEKGNGEGAEEGCPRAKARGGEAGGAEKEEKDVTEEVTETAKLTDEAVSSDRDKQAEGSSIDPPGLAVSSKDSEPLRNRNCNDTDNVDMDHSGSPESVKGDHSMKEGLKENSQAKDSVQNSVNVKPAASEMESEKLAQPTKKKREGHKGVPSNRREEGMVVPNNNHHHHYNQVSLSVTSYHKVKTDDPKKDLPKNDSPKKNLTKKDSSKKHLPSDSSERGEKHPRTDFSDVTDNKAVPVDGKNTEKALKGQTNVKEVKNEVEVMDVESTYQLSSDQDMGSS
ncbi:opioid growth factor receptor-like protein 1 isoform X2 [Salvelinus fontinalis]|uniref:opioid growth factor receptor-like protein 1 isoform X2 n=1 Tax=Salvelinus fontinalis TaxID=8038 RepID=UPI00248656D7|nr:opioid growth factor receptor-like protein 1 isoform X2 [Salvelinus fontinalis]